MQDEMHASHTYSWRSSCQVDLRHYLAKITIDSLTVKRDNMSTVHLFFDAEKGECIITMADKDLFDLMSGKLEGQKVRNNKFNIIVNE